MQFDEPAGTNLFDTARILGKPHPRIDGPLKVTGRAPYAHERHDVVAGQLHGYPLMATISHGRITAMDAAAAKAAPGVRAVVTTLDIEPLARGMNNVARLFGGDEVMHYHQAIAVVVAESFEQARAAAGLIRVSYAPGDPADYDLDAAFDRLQGTGTPDTEIGDVEAALRDAAALTDAIYRTPGESHQMMEPFASVVDWSDGGDLTGWISNQMIAWTHGSLAKTLGIDKSRIRIEAPYVGGGFGGKLWLRADTVLAALGSRAAGAPVKLALPRPMMMNNATHRSATVQRIRLAANANGRLTAIWHENLSYCLPGGRGEDATAQTPCFYATETMRVKNHLAKMPLPESADMRAPGEASGLMALEIAMDEMAEALRMDPVAFRILNDTPVNPSNPDQPFSDRNFVECLQRGAEAFGWDASCPAPGARRNGHWLIGQGVAGAFRGAPVLRSGARAAIEDGRLVIETDMTDIGTGTYTILAQTAAETMGVTMDDVEIRLGNSAYPVSAGSGGQFGAVSSSSGVYAACMALREKIAAALQLKEPVFAGGRVTEGDVDRPLLELDFDAVDSITWGKFQKQFQKATFGAHFVEVGVHAVTGETRVRRMLAVCDAGRILNPVTARSQVLGGMVMGLGAALSEHMVLDTGRGLFANHDLAGYEVAVHADIGSQEVIFLDTLDPVASPMKAKGVGELGLCGVAAAIANAMYNATGIRLRDYPLTLDRMLADLPAV